MNIKNIAFIRVLLFLGTIVIQQIAFATVNDVIIIIDTERNEEIENNGRAMTWKTLFGLQQKIAPMIVSSSILEVITNLRQQIGNHDLSRLRKLIQTTSDKTAVETLSDQLITTHAINESDRNTLPLLSLIDFDNNNWNLYLHKTANLALLIPKQYIQTNLPQAIQLNALDRASACGFNSAVITAINDLTASNVLGKLQLQQSKPIDTEKFVSNLTALFIPKKDSKWAIYLTGHGNSAQSIENIRKFMEEDKESLALWQDTLTKDPKDINAKEQIAFYESEVKRREKRLANNKGLLVMPDTAHIAGLDLNDFAQLIQFFDKNINTAYLHYSTCFGGGYNQTLLNEILSSLRVNFLVSSEGIDETNTYSFFPEFIPNDTGHGLILAEQPFSDFFKLLRVFIDNPEEFVKIKGGKKEPLAAIIRSIVPKMTERNQPFVRIPAVGTFGALSLDKSTKILTEAIVKAHEFEKRPIDLSNDTEITTLIVNPSRINVPLNLGMSQKGQRAIVSPTPKNVSPSYEAIHVFKEINVPQATTLQSFLFNLICLNARHHTQTFIINKLTGINYGVYDFPGKVKKEDIIHNLIVQIKGILGTNNETNLHETLLQDAILTAQDIVSDRMGANITVAFVLKGDIYQCSFGITNFNTFDLGDAFTTITFTSAPIEKTNIEELAKKFMALQEVTKLTKPITLDSIVKHFDAKIDKQGIITPEMQEQPTIGLSALRK